MVKTLCAAVLLVAFATSAQAGVILNLSGNRFPANSKIQLADNDPATPLVIEVAIALDGTPSIGSISTSSAEGDTFATTYFTVSGTATGGFGSTVTLSLTGESDGGARDINARDDGGIGMNDGNNGRIDNGDGTVNERINVEFDATDALLVGQQIRLKRIGIAGSNNITDNSDPGNPVLYIPDLGVKDFDGSDILFVDVTTAGSTNPAPTFYSITNGALLAGGSIGTIAIGQPDPAVGGNAGFRLNAIEFDIVSVPEPSGLLLVAIPAMACALRRLKRKE